MQVFWAHNYKNTEFGKRWGAGREDLPINAKRTS